MKELQKKSIKSAENAYKEKLASYLKSLKRKGYSPATLKAYGDALQSAFSSLAGRAALSALAASDLEGWLGQLRERGLADATLQLHARALRQFFGWLEQRGELFENPAKGLTLPPTPKKLPRVPSVSEVKRLLSLPDVNRKTGIRDRAILELAYSAGLRRKELIRLSIFAIELDARQVRVFGKGRKERVVPIGNQAAKWLGNYLRHARPKLAGNDPAGDALWLDQLGKALTTGALQAIAYRYTREAKLDYGLHSLRRAYATHLLQGGAHPVKVQMMLGHANLKTLAHYVRLDISELQATHARSNPGK